MAKGVRISIDANELHRLARDLNGTDERLRQGRQKFIRDKVTGLLEQSEKEAFEQEADPETNKRWEEWTEKYRQHVMKLTNGRGHPMFFFYRCTFFSPCSQPNKSSDSGFSACPGTGILRFLHPPAHRRRYGSYPSAFYIRALTPAHSWTDCHADAARPE